MLSIWLGRRPQCPSAQSNFAPSSRVAPRVALLSSSNTSRWAAVWAWAMLDACAVASLIMSAGAVATSLGGAGIRNAFAAGVGFSRSPAVVPVVPLGGVSFSKVAPPNVALLIVVLLPSATLLCPLLLWPSPLAPSFVGVGVLALSLCCLLLLLLWTCGGPLLALVAVDDVALVAGGGAPLLVCWTFCCPLALVADVDAALVACMEEGDFA